MLTDLIKIRDDLGCSAHLEEDPNGGYILLAGPKAPVGAIYQAINDLHHQRVEDVCDADDELDDGERHDRCERLRSAAQGGGIPTPRSRDVTNGREQW
ncbi:hypothetical protein JOD54_001410 [Actinokineospora baliensis]|uniref:hypothetical protein n=1 Tax=Actinokineospora baliensis TaxID=547056 RepID=UPI0019597791|nr:hypothetical protein [Actinokineospora baliensis]MBM7771206.1 hypothetical protein [Actinokineospora baliensis]